MDITRLISRIATDGMAKVSRFRFLMASPLGINFPVGTLETLADSCEMAEHPGRNFVTADSDIYGPVYKSPVTTAYPEANFVFLCDERLTQKSVFEQWMNYINPPSSFDVAFRGDYVTDIIVEQLSDVGNTPKFYTRLVEAYPISIAPLQGNWGDEAIHKVQVTMTYRYHVIWKESSTNDENFQSPLTA